MATQLNDLPSELLQQILLANDGTSYMDVVRWCTLNWTFWQICQNHVYWEWQCRLFGFDCHNGKRFIGLEEEPPDGWKSFFKWCCQFDHNSMFDAAFKGYAALVTTLLDAGADIDAICDDETLRDYGQFGETALIIASWKGHVDIVRLLLDRGADILESGWRDETPLMAASCMEDNVEIVRLLLDRGANVAIDHHNVAIDHHNYEGNTALTFASRLGRVEIVRLLLDRGADINFVYPHHLPRAEGVTALARASGSGQMETVQLLLDRGADVNLGSVSEGVKPLLLASWEGEKGVDVMRLLLDGGADVEAADNHGFTALMGASCLGTVEAMRLLLDRGADINATDKGVDVGVRRTPLMCASDNGKVEAVRLLLDRGADINATDKDGKTALMFAVECKHMEIVRLLEFAKDWAAAKIDDDLNIGSHRAFHLGWMAERQVVVAGGITPGGFLHGGLLKTHYFRSSG